MSGRSSAPGRAARNPATQAAATNSISPDGTTPYFRRLKDFVSLAGQRRVVVELNLFCPFYDETQWRLSPMNAANNINGVGAIARTNAYTLDRARRPADRAGKPGPPARHRTAGPRQPLLRNLQRTVLRRRHPSLAAAHRRPITATEEGLGCRHLISQNIANDKGTVTDPFPTVSIFNFHYASPPDTVAMNYGLNRAIGDNETGFNTTNDAPYRREAWNCMLAGGTLFNHLDYSFTAGHKDGDLTATPPASRAVANPGFPPADARVGRDSCAASTSHMRPDNGVILDGVPAGQTARALVKPDRAWAIYLARIGRPWKKSEAAASTTLRLVLPPGAYRAQWLEPATGRWWERQQFDHAGGVVALCLPGLRH